MPLNEKDFDALYEIASDPMIWIQHNDTDRYKKDVFQNFFIKALESKTAFTITDHKTGELIGSTRFYDYNEEDKSIAIGFTFLGCKFWGKGFNPSVKKLMLDYAFCYVDKVIFHIAATNIRSQIATSRLGAEKTNEFITADAIKPRLSFEYILDKERWERINGR